MQYTVFVEKTAHNYSAYAPDLPGCVTTGETIDEIRENMAVSISLHLDGMIEVGEPIPAPSTPFEPSPDQFEVEISVQYA